MGKVNPTLPQFHVNLAYSQNEFGLLLARQKRFAEAFTALATGLAIRQKLLGADSENIEYAKLLGYSYAYRGKARVLPGQPAFAAAELAGPTNSGPSCRNWTAMLDSSTSARWCFWRVWARTRIRA